MRTFEVFLIIGILSYGTPDAWYWDTILIAWIYIIAAFYDGFKNKNAVTRAAKEPRQHT
jgi:hypothetical protein